MKSQAITGSTKLAGIIGGPGQVARSLSPAIHNAAFRALGLDWVYLPFPVENAVALAVRGLFAAGVVGLNVTMPHKIAAAGAVDFLEGEALRTGAVNTVETKGGRLAGHNTDGDGLIRFLTKDLGFLPEGTSVFLIGAGGAARSAVSALARAGAKSITVAARNPERAESLRSLSAPAAFRTSPLHDGDALAESDLIINATPAGQLGEEPLIPTEAIPSTGTVVDLVYVPASTKLVSAARKRGARASGGLGMLLHQACLSFEIWTGIEPPIEVMSAAAVASLKRRQPTAD